MTDMDRTNIYVVSSFREYGNGERYFGADGLFRTMEEAEEYIRNDIRETIADFRDTFDEEIPASAIDDVSDCYADFRISYADKYFAWRIDYFTHEKLRWKYGTRRDDQ